jgi:WD repeat-containing protein 26
MIRKQKYLELLEVGQVQKAVHVLQKELTPLHVNTSELHNLARLIICTFDEINLKTGWDGKHGKSRSTLLDDLTKYISPSMCIPPRRLNTLLDQAVEYQKQKCIYHNSPHMTGLLTDHTCDRNSFPSITSHVFEEHQDEVWFMAFSHDGKKLASASRDARAIIWDVEHHSLKFILDDHKNAISYLAWSPDDSMLLTASNDKTLKLWDAKVVVI